MRSPADRVRVERALRIVALAALAIWIANAARPRTGRSDVVRGASLTEALPRWTQADAVDSVHVQLDTAPDATSVAWLTALGGAGVRVAWTGPSIEAVALETYPAGDPAGGVFVPTSAPATTARVLSDALGPIDTLPSAHAPIVSRVAAVEGTIAVTSGSQPARAEVAPSGAPRRVLVSGAAGWEAKFVIAALEEHGWTVDAHLFVAPDHDVYQGARAELDTSRYSAVVLLDSAAAERKRGVEQFARAGGGVVLAADASKASRVAGLVAWRAGKRETAPLGTLPGDTAWRGLSRVVLDTIAERRAIALESRNGRPVVVARRHYAGRVVAVGYDQTWRWRMAGGDNGRVEHRDWWSRVVASVAARPATDRESLTTSAAPLASLYQALGPPAAAARALPIALSPSALSNLLGLVFLTTLLAEWLLRRARGAQ